MKKNGVVLCVALGLVAGCLNDHGITDRASRPVRSLLITKSLRLKENKKPRKILPRGFFICHSRPVSSTG